MGHYFDRYIIRTHHLHDIGILYVLCLSSACKIISHEEGESLVQRLGYSNSGCKTFYDQSFASYMYFITILFTLMCILMLTLTCRIAHAFPTQLPTS